MLCDGCENPSPSVCCTRVPITKYGLHFLPMNQIIKWLLPLIVCWLKAYICACHGACSANEVQLSKDENFGMNKADRML